MSHAACHMTCDFCQVSHPKRAVHRHRGPQESNLLWVRDGQDFVLLSDFRQYLLQCPYSFVIGTGRQEVGRDDGDDGAFVIFFSTVKINSLHGLENEQGCLESLDK